MLEFIIQPMHSLDLQVGDLVEKECEVNKEGAVFSWLKDDNLLPEGKDMGEMKGGHGLNNRRTI